MLLNRRQLEFLVQLLQLRPEAQPRLPLVRRQISIESRAISRAARMRAPETKVHRDGIVRLARLNPDRAPNRASLNRQRHAIFRLQIEFLRRRLLTRTALSHVRRVTGLGSSCSHVLLANWPSYT